MKESKIKIRKAKSESLRLTGNKSYMDNDFTTDAQYIKAEE